MIKAVGTTFTKQTIGNRLRHNGLKSCSAPYLRRHMFKFTSKHLMIQKRLGRKCCGQMTPKLSSLASTQLEEEKC